MSTSAFHHKNGAVRCLVNSLFWILGSLLFTGLDIAAQTSGGPSTSCHITDGTFTTCQDGTQEWSDVPANAFPESQAFLYSDQADLDPLLQSVHPVTGEVSDLDTFVLMYDECGRTTPLESNEYFLVTFDTVEVEAGEEKLERYIEHIFTDGTLIFIEDGVLQTNAQGEFRVEEIDGQRGTVGFGQSPNCPFDHVIVEFQIILETASGNSYSPDPSFWSATPPEPPEPQEPKIIIVSEHVHGLIPPRRKITTVVANIGTGDAPSLRIEQRPFAAINPFLEKFGPPQVANFSLAAGESKSFTFEFDRALGCGYSDIFDNTGTIPPINPDGWIAATSCDTIRNPSSLITFDFALPYPTHVENVLGTQQEFFLGQPNLDNFPPDWTLVSLTPAPGEVFTLSPGERVLGNLIMEAPDDAPEGTIARIVIPYEHPPTNFLNEIRLTGVIDTEPPTIANLRSVVTNTLLLRVEADVADEVSSLSVGEVLVEYSDNGGNSFSQQPMELRQPTESNTVGVTRSQFKAEIGPFPLNTEIAWKIVARDRAANVSESLLNMATIVPSPMSIDTLNPFRDITLAGDYVAAGIGLRDTTAGTISITDIPSDATVVDAFLYWGMLDNGESPGLKNLNFNGTPITGTLIGRGPDTCWGRSNSFAYRAEVTSFVPGNGTYNLTGVAGGGNILAQGASLVVVYENPNDSFRDVILLDGNVVFPQFPTATTVITGFLAADPVSAKTTFVVGDGQSFSETASFTGSNGTLNMTNPFEGSDGTLWDTDTVAVSQEVGSGSNPSSVTITMGSDCLMWVAQAFSVTTVRPESDLEGDGVLDELDNCPNTPNSDQQDTDLNGIGDACQTPDLQHSTAAFLEARLDGTSTAEPTSLNVEDEPTLQNRLVPIVNFRVNEGLTDSAAQLTQNLVNSVVEIGLVTQEKADELVDEVLEQVVDTTPPFIESLSTSPNVLWPPNHKMVPVNVSAVVTDDRDGEPICHINAVSSNETVDGLGSGQTTLDWEVTGALSADLRAERSGKGNGRVYTITVQCTDASGNSAADTTFVTVPHDKRGKEKKD